MLIALDLGDIPFSGARDMVSFIQSHRLRTVIQI